MTYEELQAELERERQRRARALSYVRLLARSHFVSDVDGEIRCQCPNCKEAEKFLAEEATKWPPVSSSL